MAFRATICGSCGKEIQVPSDVKAPACPYCGHVVPEGAAPAATISTLLGLARTALVANNQQEALVYFNRVLESNPTNADAWLGKGKAAGWQSTLSNIRLSEMLIAFNHAIANAAEENKEAVAIEANTEVNNLAVTLYGMGRKHMLEYISLPKIWSEYVQQVRQMVDALSLVSTWVPTHQMTLKNIIWLCKDNIEGVSYIDKFNNHLPKVKQLSYEEETPLRGILNSSLERLKALDPTYEAPKIEKKTACFVVTATMGDCDHPTVTLLRRFRDDWLLTRKWGVRLIDWYYRHGPAAANFIAASTIRRRASYVLIVRPSAWVACRLL